MAIQVSPVYIADYRRRKDGVGKEPKWRLPREKIACLQDVARGVEETNVGIACRYLIDHLSNIGSSDIDEDGYINHLSPLENFCDRYDIWGHNEIIETWRRDIRRCRRAIERMRLAGQGKHASVLFIVYGYPDPSVRDLPKRVLDTLGELSALARYTERVEDHRKELARQEAVRLSQNIQPMELPPTSNWIENFMRKDASEAEQVSMAIRHGYRSEAGGVMLDLIRHRDRYEWALRVVSSGDALRSLFAPISNREEGESQDHFMIRKENAETKRDAVTTEIKLQAVEMLKEASLVYKEAWRASA